MVTVLLSYLLLKEKCRAMNVIQLILGFSAFILISVGIESPVVNESNDDKMEYARYDHFETTAYILLLIMPFFNSVQNIALKCMSKMHSNTLSCYQNPFLMLVSGVTLLVRGEDMGLHFLADDWRVAALILWLSLSTVVLQVIKFTAYKYEDASNLVLFKNW